MKTLHLVYSIHPSPAGGTEVYVEGLCRALRDAGEEAVIAAPAATDARYLVKGVRVRGFEHTPEPKDLAILYGQPDPVAVRAFERVLDEERPDLFHQHAISPACSVELMARAKARGIPVVFTYHTPAASCQRGTLLRWGTDVCDGCLTTSPCTECALTSYVSRPLAKVLARVPPSVGAAVGRRLSGRVWTGLRMSSLVARRVAEAQRLFTIADQYVALAPWVRALLVGNGVPPERIVDVAHGTDVTPIPATSRPRRSSVPGANRSLRIAHLGRFDPTKGTDVIVRAVRALPAARISLDIFGVTQAGGEAYARMVRTLASGDGRIVFRPPVPHEAIAATLSEYDAVAVPSQWLETGPLVVLEAFAAGVPVIGSAIGGLADKIRDGEDGILVRPHDRVPAWSAALAHALSADGLLDRLRASIRAPRTVRAVAADLQSLYDRLCPGGRPVGAGVRDPVAS
jgi:glycosyltransferase involved in cell wall biosynthesis